jgi:hypothetical protein
MRRALLLLLILSAAVLAAGASPLDVRPVAYEVDAHLDPARHELRAEVVVDLELLDEIPRRKGVLELRLHPDLALEAVRVDGAELRSRRSRRGRIEDDGTVVPTRHRLRLREITGPLRVRLAYHGPLRQDIGAGEVEGEIHNFAVSAHIAEEGIYLEPDGYWYPRVDLPGGIDPLLTLSDFRLRVAPIDGFEMVAGLEAEEAPEGVLAWRSPFPLDGLVLLGGPLERWSREHGGIRLHAVLAPGKESVAADILDAAAAYLDRYQPLIGPYPFREFTVLEAFFSSGFAFPTCTQIAGSQLSEYKQYRRHGYLDHELLHNWWGNGLFVDPRDGNWCEGLATYLGNYYGHVLDGDEEGARKQRRNESNFLSTIEPGQDRPLGTFGTPDGAGRGIGYDKGAATFHMLERTIGQEALFAGLRRLTAERMGRPTSWDDLREAFERESGVDLEAFFEQWVRRPGAPALELLDARPGPDGLIVGLSQGNTDFLLDVPLRLHRGDRTEDVVVRLEKPADELEVPCDPEGLTAVELDPDYHVFRRLKAEEVMPTSSLTRHTSHLLIVVPDGELAEGYRVVRDAFTRAVLGEEDEPEPGHDVVVRKASELDPAALGSRSVLILGEAVRNPAVVRFLERTRSPVAWTPSGFAVDGQAFDGPGQAVFLTVHHPDAVGEGVTVYRGNGDGALANARLLHFYPNSLLVFDTPVAGDAGLTPETEMPRSNVVLRLDFEFHDRIEL